MFKSWLLELKRRKLLRQCKQSNMRDYLQSQAKSARSKDILAVDLETTGLHAHSDKIISIGSVLIRDLKIVLSSCHHQIINPNIQMNQSAVIHRITDDDLQSGIDLKAAFDELLLQLKGRSLLAHNAKVEQSFLNRACKELYGIELFLPVIDTIAIEHARLTKTGHVLRKGELRLAACRNRYNLPVYKAHNALNDALACAELYLAQIQS